MVGGLASDDELMAIRAAIDVASPVKLEGLVQEPETPKDRTFGGHNFTVVGVWRFTDACLCHRANCQKGEDNEVLHGGINA